MPKKTLKTYRSEYRQTLSEIDDPYAFAIQRDATLSKYLYDAEERVRAFPEDKNEHHSLIQLIIENQAVWEECERRLRAISYGAGVDKTAIASQINQSHEKATEYKEKFSDAIKNELSHTSALYKAGESMQTTGKAMQGAGNTMKSTGHDMTVGCTIPIIIFILLMILFIFL